MASTAPATVASPRSTTSPRLSSAPASTRKKADLCSTIPSLALYDDCECMTCEDGLPDLSSLSLSHFLEESLNRAPNRATLYAGASAFALKGAYWHVDPSARGEPAAGPDRRAKWEVRARGARVCVCEGGDARVEPMTLHSKCAVPSVNS